MAPAVLVVCSALALVPGRVSAAPQEEVFEEVDPYTEGDPAVLGYVSYGPFPWAKGHTSNEVEDTVGATSILFLETEHFRIASTLESYQPQGDRVEKEHLEKDFALLKKKIRRFKPPTKLDPWLRAHIYAQRLEAQYADFRDRFGFTDEEFAPEAQTEDGPKLGGPFLGQKSKHTVLLSQTQAGLGRYLERYIGHSNEYSYRWSFGDCYFLGINQEGQIHIGRELDICLHVALSATLALNLVESFRGTGHESPLWFRFGLSHYYARRVDPRWNVWGAGGHSNWEVDRQWVWEPRIRGLVENEAVTSWRDMLSWTARDQVKARDHMIAWSRVRWLLEEEPDGLRALILGLTDPLQGETPQEKAASSLAHQLAAFEAAYGKTPEELEKEWARHVRRKYAKK